LGILESLQKQKSGRLVPAVARLVSLHVFAAVAGFIGSRLCLLGGVCRVDLLHVDVGLAVAGQRVAVLVELRRRLAGLGHRRSGARNLRWSFLLLW